MSCPSAPIKVSRKRVYLIDDDETQFIESPMAKHLDKRRKLACTEVLSISSDESSSSDAEDEDEDEESTDSLTSDPEDSSEIEVVFPEPGSVRIEQWVKPAALPKAPVDTEPIPVIILDEVAPALEKKKAENPSDRWCFTLNNYTTEEYATLLTIMPSQCKWAIIAKEVGEDNAVPHLQGIPSLRVEIALDCYCGWCREAINNLI